MSFVMISSGVTGPSRLRMLTRRHLVLGSLLSSALLLGAGTGLGYWLAGALAVRDMIPEQSEAVPAAARPALASAAVLPFTLEQLGAISARLFRLESQAAQLGYRIGVLQKGDPALKEGNVSAAKGAKPGTPPGSGGPMLPPRGVWDAGALDGELARVEQQIALVADAAARRSSEAMRMPTRLPVAHAPLVSGFGNRHDPFNDHPAFHAGLDFAAERGTPIHAAAGGRVAYAGFRSDFGWVVEIEHGNGLTSRYAHTSKLLVRDGAVVVPGQPIALVGSTGRSTGPHLHFEILRHGSAVDPKRYLAGL